MTHSPRYIYDCGNCKFNWTCGRLCRCVLKKDRLPEPPVEVKRRVDADLIAAGYDAEFHTGVQEG